MDYFGFSSATLGLVVLLALGIGLFVFNMYQAASGWRTMRQINRDRHDHETTMDRVSDLQDRLVQLKSAFHAAVTDKDERTELWAPVDREVAAAALALSASNTAAAIRHLNAAVAEARSLYADFASESEPES